MSQYANLDELIVEKISTKGGQFTHVLSQKSVYDECSRIARATGRERFRVLDGRLQSLKKAGVISYGAKTGWVLASQDKAGVAA